MASIAEVLSRCSLFQGLSEEQIERIAQISTVERLPAGATVFTAGSPATNLYVLQEGSVALNMKVQVGSRAPRDATVEVLTPGNAFGLSALVPPYILTLSATCLDPSTVVVIDGTRLRELTESDPRLGSEVLKRLSSSVTRRNEEIVQRLDHFVSIVSHELRAPLAAVESYLQILLGGFAGELSEKQRNMLERSSIRIRELIGLISDVVDSSRMEARNITQGMEMTSIVQILERSLEEVEAAAREKNVKLRVNVPPTLPHLKLAPGRIRQVFTNLLGNAVKYTPDGGSVTLRAFETEDHVRVEVIDTGIGIPPNELSRVFEEFYRASNNETKGAGLGLHITKRIVEVHGGQIWAESPYPPARGKGSRFCVLLPKAERSQPQEQAASKAVQEQ